MAIANRASEAAAIKRRLVGGGSVLIVGSRSTNFDETFRQHPRLTFWDSTDAGAVDLREVPANTRVIICTRFMSHKTFGRLQRTAAKRQLVIIPGLNNTGEIKDVLSMALDIPSTPTPPPPTPPPPPPPRQPWLAQPPENDPAPAIRGILDRGSAPVREPRVVGGDYRAFLKAHANLDGSPAQEIARLMPVLNAAGFHPTEGAAKQMLYMLRRERDGLPSTVLGKPTPKPTPAADAAPVSNISEALRVIDEVALGLNLLREVVLKVQNDETQLQATMAALRGFLNPPPSRS